MLRVVIGAVVLLLAVACGDQAGRANNSGANESRLPSKSFPVMPHTVAGVADAIGCDLDDPPSGQPKETTTYPCTNTDSGLEITFWKGKRRDLAHRLDASDAAAWLVTTDFGTWLIAVSGDFDEVDTARDTLDIAGAQLHTS